MGLFDRWRKGGGGERVPAGHRVTVHGAGPVPGVARTEGGTWLVELGSASDDAAAELEGVLGALEPLLAGPRPRVLVANVTGTLASLFAPANPALHAVEGSLVWSVDEAAVLDARLADRLVGALEAARAAAPEVAQMLCVRGPCGALPERARALGVAARAPGQGGALFAEVHRPEGVVLTAWLAGPPEAPAPREAGRPRIVARAPRLERLLAGCADGGEPAWDALQAELLARDAALLAIADPETRAVSPRQWPNGFSGLVFYPDEATLLAAARDLGHAPGSFGLAALPPREAFAWAARGGLGVALSWRRGDAPLNVPLPAEAVASLARGEAAPFPFRR